MKMTFLLSVFSEKDAEEINKKLIETNDEFKQELKKIFLKLPNFLKNMPFVQTIEPLSNLNLFSSYEFKRIEEDLDSYYCLKIEINETVLKVFNENIPLMSKLFKKALTKERIVKKIEKDLNKHAMIINKLIE